MGHVPAPLFEAAVESLRGKHSLAVLVIPAMVRAGVTVAATPGDGKPFGSTDENSVLEAYFKIAGAPPGLPYHAVWHHEPHWVDARYAGRAAQRMRTDRVKSGQGFMQDASVTPHLWSFTVDLGSKLSSLDGGPVRIVDLAIWYGREREADDLDELTAWFLGEFPLDQAELVGNVYSDDVPDHYKTMPFAPEPLSQSEYAEILGNAPAPVVYAHDLTTLATNVEATVTAKGFQSSPGLVQRIVAAWARGDIAVLVGQGGTGKTFLAHLMEEALRQELGGLTSVLVTVTPGFDDSDFIGYERLDGELALRDFAARVLKSENPLDPHLVVLDEFNLAQLEQYLGAVLAATEHPDRTLHLPGGEEVSLPVDALILATCNSYLDEPETRTRLSNPSKRRCAVISMPNVLLERYEAAGDAAVVTELAFELIAQERDRVQERIDRGLGSALDSARNAALSSVTSPADLSDEAKQLLERVATTLLASPEGRDFFTMAILKDVALDLAIAPRSADGEVQALIGSLGEKIVQLLRGPKQRADDLAAAIDGVAGIDAVLRQLDRMKQGPGDELMPLI